MVGQLPFLTSHEVERLLLVKVQAVPDAGAAQAIVDVPKTGAGLSLLLMLLGRQERQGLNDLLGLSWLAFRHRVILGEISRRGGK